MENLSGRRVRSYELQELIGFGGYGVVYGAYQENIKRQVAIKIIQQHYANNPEFVRQFDREAHLIARLEHPHIVPLYDFWRQPDGAYLVMRFLKGGNLGQSLARYGPLELSLAAKLIQQIASALQTAHHQGVIHQDIKPENILLDEASNAYLADFGIAKEVFQEAVESERESLQGSPDYMAPERIHGEPSTLKSDIYSFGLLIYAMLVGKSPFRDNTVFSSMLKNLQEPVPSLIDSRPDLPGELNNVIQRAAAKNPNDRYTNIARLYNDFESAIFGESGSQSNLMSARPMPTAAITGEILIPENTMILSRGPFSRNPYKGLRAFEEADADDFFGREFLVDRLIGKFRNEMSPHVSFLAIVGPSGSGKSSAIKAGLIPALREGRIEGSRQWFIISMVPGNHPLIQLEQALLQIALDIPPTSIYEALCSNMNGLDQIVRQIMPQDDARILLFIDQFEEVFALVEEEERALFLNNIYQAVIAPNSPLTIVIALRADFYDRPLAYPGFSDLIRERTEVVTPLHGADLEEAIRKPALRAGLTIGRELVQAIVDDVSGQPGALPLLQFALAELFDKRSEAHLTLEVYQQLGGISTALARRADELFNVLDADSQQYTRQLFLRLIAFDEQAGNTRQRVAQPELLSMSKNAESAQRILDFFGEHRLLTFDHDPATRTPTVEIAHESLIDNWHHLMTWLDESREARHLHRRLRDAKAEWDRNDHDESFLAKGAQLAQFQELPANPDIVLTTAEHDYVQASTRLRQRTTNRIKLAIAALLIATIGAIGMAGFAFDQQSAALDARATSEAERDRADEEAQIARSRELAMSAITQRERLDRSLLVSIEALNVHDTLEARRSLLINLLSNPILAGFLHSDSTPVRSVAYSPDGGIIATGLEDSRITLWDTESRQPLGEPLRGHSEAVWNVAFSPDGQWLASASHDDSVVLWNIGQNLDEPPSLVLSGHADDVWSLDFSPDGRHLASVGADGVVLLWDLSANPPSSTRLEGHTDIVFSVEFSPDGAWLASGGADNQVILWDMESLSPRSLQGHENWVMALAFSHDGSVLASSGAESDVLFWDVLAGESLGSITPDHSDWVRSLAISPDGSLLATGSLDNTVQLWQLTPTLQPLGSPRIGHADAIWDLSFSPDSRHLVSASSDSSVILWDVASPSALASVLEDHSQPVWDIAFSPNGCLLASGGGHATTGEDNAIRLWHTDCSEESAVGEQAFLLEGHTGAVVALDYSPDDALLAAGGANGTVNLWNLAVAEATAQLLTTMQSSVTDLHFSQDGQILALADDIGTVNIWQNSGTQWTLFQEASLLHQPGINSLALSADGAWLATAGRDQTVRLWNVTTLEPIGQILDAHTDEVTSLAFSPDGQLLASGGRDQSIILWDLASFQPLGDPLIFHTNWVTSLAFDAQATTLASGSRDRSVMMWDVATRVPLGPPFVTGHDWVTSIRFNPDGGMLAVSSMDGGVVLWNMNPDSWKDLACQIANRNFTPFEWRSEFGTSDYNASCPGFD